MTGALLVEVRSVISVDWVEALGVVLGAILAAMAILSSLRWAWSRTLGRPLVVSRGIKRLAPGCTVEYFASCLGAVAMRRSSEGFTEHVWLDPLYFVQAIANEDGTVVRWAVTVRTWLLPIRLSMPPYSSNRLRLGWTALAAADPKSIDRVEASIGARRWRYAERHYFGNPGGYQHFWLGFNDAAPEGRGLQALVEAGLSMDNTIELDTYDRERLEGLRRRVVPNTYSESVPFHQGDPFQLFIGVDADLVRVAVKPTRRLLRPRTGIGRARLMPAAVTVTSQPPVADHVGE